MRYTFFVGIQFCSFHVMSHFAFTIIRVAGILVDLLLRTIEPHQMPSPFDSIMPLLPLLPLLLPLLTLPHSKAVSTIERPQPPPGIVRSTEYCLCKCVMYIRTIIYLANCNSQALTWYLIPNRFTILTTVCVDNISS